jgi:S-adenosylmethionine-diacylglycerol 3-amino-3-carboxypropyl transferase
MVDTAPAPSLTRRSFTAAHDLAFNRVHGSNLIYNTAWEDPRLDRELLQLDAQSRVVMITSAGCNVLDYLLDNPAEIHSIDMNHRQNALLELKLALIQHSDYESLYQMFGCGAHPKYSAVYQPVREHLAPPTRQYWDKYISLFDPSSLKRSFYYQGTAGMAAWLTVKALFKARPNLIRLAGRLLESTSLNEQKEIYARLEPEIWGRLSTWLIRQPALMAMLGVPRAQISLICRDYPGGLAAYIQEKLKHVMTEVPISDNYFWRVYLTGHYTKDCCPEYLKEEHFETLKANAPRAITHTMSVAEFLRQNPAAYSHYVLLDHQDWLAWNDTAALAEEWNLILANSRKGTRIILRSAANELDFIPESIRQHLCFHPELTAPLHRQDRVGTYGSLHLAEVL